MYWDMDLIPIADLEAELGCFDQGLVDIGPRKDHGGSDKVFEVPAEAASRLEPPSKTKSVYPFGADGTLAWATPAGELLQLASCTKGKLAGVDYRNSIEKGQGYQPRTKMLQKALNLPQGSGNGIGLSLNLNLHPINVHWVYNRWPRFIYHFRGMEIRLQYYVTLQSVVQQYQIRNDGDDDISLPYIISTDILFRDHDLETEIFRPIPVQKTSERLMLSQNSELLVSNELNDVQFEIAVFLNKQRISIWMDNQPSDGEDEAGGNRDSEVGDQGLPRIEKALRDAIVDQRSMSSLLERLYRSRYILETLQTSPGDRRPQTHKRTNFAKFHNTLVVPRGSSQELCAIVKISGPLQPEKVLDQSASKSVSAQSKDRAVNRQGLLDDNERIISKIRHEENALTRQWEDSSFDTSDTRRMAQVIRPIQKRLRLGQALASVGQVGEARYYFFTASLIAERVHKEDIDLLGVVRFRYATFLLEHGWYSDGLKQMEDLVQDISNGEGKKAKTAKLWSEVRIRLASIYLNLGRFSEAENLYQQSLQHLTTNTSVLELVSAPVWERIAWAKVNQGHYEQASTIYTRFLDQGSASRRTLFSNLGFIKRRLGQFADAQKFYLRAIEESNGDPTYKTNEVFARSGLSSCLRSLGATPESIDGLSASSIKYIDINDTLSQVQYSQSPSKDHPFGFVLSRYLETLLSLCSIPIRGKDVSGIIFVDADPVECAYEGRSAFFQFKFLIQYHQYLSKINHHESVDAKRIQATCEAHLVWVFKIAPTLDTWYAQYSVGGASENSSVENPSEENPLSDVVEGAFHFLKLCLYHEIWNEKWESVLGLLHPALEKWLSYLASTQHMANLWMENENIESLKPQHDSLSRDRDTINQAFPQYYLSDFSVLWLALMQLEHLIASIEHTIKIQNRNPEDTARLKTQKVRETFNSRPPTLSPENVQSNIINTFKVFKRVGESNATDTTTNSIRATVGESTAFTGPFDNSPMSGDPRNKVENPLQDGAIRRRDQQLIVFHRTISEYIFEVQPTDITTLEAYIFGMFENPQDQDAWHATINIQEEKNTTSSWETRLIALALLGLKIGLDIVRINEDKIEDVKSKEVLLRKRLSAASYDSGCFAVTTALDQPEQIQSWSGVWYEPLSVLMASLYEECRTLFPSNGRQEGQGYVDNSQRQISTAKTRSRTQNRKTTKRTGALSTFSRVDQKNVCDTGFLPDWMYHYPAFIHEQPLVISSKQDLKQLSSIEGLKSAVDRYKDSQDFQGIYDLHPSDMPAMVDSGVKKRTNPEDAFPKRQLNITIYYDSALFWAQLLKPRTPDQAKKRLIELSSQDKDSALMCWLSSPQQEKPFLWLFFSRNDALENFFGERADLTANLWETEFHLGFYQLLDATDSPRRSHSREMPSLSQNQKRRNIAPVALSFRFVGDLRDRFWSCLFLSSETIGFKGLVQQYYDSSMTREELYEKQGQRKTLEIFYVERMLNEMVMSIDIILSAFRTELAVSPKNQSFEFIYHYSGLQFHLEASEILQEVLQKLDLSIKVIEDWEKREDTRGLRSRWSLKDEDRYGEMLKHLTQKCKIDLQKLRIQHNQLGEQRKYADQWYSNLVSYKQLQEAHASTQSAEDVRLFTYVTIIFLPLSFSSSLFSMGGTPQATTLAVMGPTTVIALALTILLLANMNLLNRKLRFWFDKAKHNAREKMAASKNSSVSDWSRVSKELTEAAQLQVTGMDTKKRLPAESKWWYFFFWLCYCFRLPRILVRSGFRAWKNWNGPSLHLIVRTLLALISLPACTLVFIVEVLLLMMYDTLILILATLRSTQNRLGDGKAIGRRDVDGTNAKDKDSISEKTTASKPSSVQSAWVRILKKLYGWLKSPPRPVKHHRVKRYPPAADQKAQLPLTQESSDSESDSDSSDISSIHATELPRDEIDEWISSPTNDIVLEPHPDASANPARGTTTDETRTQIEDFV